jgi:outer membrane receptor protein involved in Fe transport
MEDQLQPAVRIPAGQWRQDRRSGRLHVHFRADQQRRADHRVEPAGGFDPDASIAYSDPGDHYKITVGGTNLTGERYVTSGSAIPAFGAIVASYNRPAEWYARLGFKF